MGDFEELLQNVKIGKYYLTLVVNLGKIVILGLCENGREFAL